MSKEIVMAGVRYNNIVYDGFNHGECFKKLPIDANMVDIEQGFITSDGEFVDRKKAFTIARKAHQLEYDYGIQKVLISEDVHINWLHKKDKTIADLEAKLAESEENNKLLEMQLQDMERSKLSWENQYFTLYNTLKNYREVIEKQLAEKDEEIKQLNNRILISQLQAPKEQILNILGSQCIQYNPDQDKISFALEQLEKVKENILSNITFGIESVGIMNSIDNQIKQLKEME